MVSGAVGNQIDPQPALVSIVAQDANLGGGFRAGSEAELPCCAEGLAVGFEHLVLEDPGICVDLIGSHAAKPFQPGSALQPFPAAIRMDPGTSNPEIPKRVDEPVEPRFGSIERCLD